MGQVLALICVHPFGIPQAVEAEIDLAHAVGAVVIEDAAQAMGARWKEQPVGVRGDFGLYSLGPGKPLSVGGGGVVSTNDQRQAQLLQKAWQDLPAAPVTMSAWSLISLAANSVGHQSSGLVVGRSFRLCKVGGCTLVVGAIITRQLSSAQARVGVAQLAELDDINRVRRQNGRQLRSQLQGLDFVHIPEIPPEADPIYLRLPIIVDTAERRRATLPGRFGRPTWAQDVCITIHYRRFSLKLSHPPLP